MVVMPAVRQASARRRRRGWRLGQQSGRQPGRQPGRWRGWRCGWRRAAADGVVGGAVGGGNWWMIVATVWRRWRRRHGGGGGDGEDGGNSGDGGARQHVEEGDEDEEDERGGGGRAAPTIGSPAPDKDKHKVSSGDGLRARHAGSRSGWLGVAGRGSREPTRRGGRILQGCWAEAADGPEDPPVVGMPRACGVRQGLGGAAAHLLSPAVSVGGSRLEELGRQDARGCSRRPRGLQRPC